MTPKKTAQTIILKHGTANDYVRIEAEPGETVKVTWEVIKKET